MFSLKVYNKTNRFKKSLVFKFEQLRFLTAKEAANKKDIETVSRRYLKPVTIRNLKPFNENVLRGLFCCNIHSSIFEYPAVLRSADINVILEHTTELEKFLGDNLKAELNDEIISNLKELELFGLTLPQEFGGAGYTQTEATYLLECAGISPTIARFLSYQSLGCKLLELYGSEEQKAKYLPKLAAGESFISVAYLENGPLIDFSKFLGNAFGLGEKNQFILNAEKKWVHNADRADVFLLMVKTSIPDGETEDIKLKFNMFVIDRKTPGVTIHKLINKNLQEYDFCDVTFKEVTVPYDYSLGNVGANGFDILKSSLSYNNLNDATLCCSLVKRIIHHISQFIREKGLSDTSIRGNGLLQENLALLSTHVFGLESLLYLISGRFDTFEKPDLFNESVLLKVFAIDVLQVAIKKYVASVGRDSLKASEILDEALKNLHYYSVFDENIEYFKMMVAGDGISQSASLLSPKVRLLRKPYEDVKKLLRVLVTSEESRFREYKSRCNIKNELPKELTQAADILENNCAKLLSLVEDLFSEYGSLLMDNENYIIKLAEVSAYLYATIASLSRAANSLYYNFEGQENDLMLSQAFTLIADEKINSLATEHLKYFPLIDFCRLLGKATFNNKEYPAEHPLTRTF